MTTPIDYSRPVGWWCPVCGLQEKCVDITGLVLQLEAWCCAPTTPAIPVYLPIPEGQRPLVEDEVEEAEVVTLDPNGNGGCWYMDNKLIHCVDKNGRGWTFNDIAQFSLVKP